MSKIVVVIGSARKDGNTEILADSFIKGAAAAGNEVVKIRLRDNPVNPCLACDYCIKHEGQCVQKDGFQAIQEALYSSDVLVLASPVYTYGFTAQMKAVLDRFYSSIARSFSVKSSVLLAVYGGTRNEIVAPMIANYQILVKEMKMDDLGIITVGSVLAKGDIKNHSALQQAENLGKKTC